MAMTVLTKAEYARFMRAAEGLENCYAEYGRALYAHVKAADTVAKS